MRMRAFASRVAAYLAGSLASGRVVPVTSWPIRTRSGVRRRPITPAAPARKIRMMEDYRIFRRSVQRFAAENAINVTSLPHMPRLRKNFFNRSVHEVAPELIGATLLFNGVGGIIAEVEAYHHTDPAAHSFGGETERNAVMFGPPGYAYVYRSYGIHWCVNFVCECAGSARAVLIRALEPTEGLAAMHRRRRNADARLLCSGPGRLTAALGINRAHNAIALAAPPL